MYIIFYLYYNILYYIIIAMVEITVLGGEGDVLVLEEPAAGAEPGTSTIYYLLYTIYYLLSTIYYLLFTICYILICVYIHRSNDMDT